MISTKFSFKLKLSTATDITIYSVLAERINFTIDLILDDKDKWGVLHTNGSSTGAMQSVIEKKADLTIGKFAMTSTRIDYMKPSISYYASPLIIVVPVGEPYTALEKLMKPFGDLTWTFVMMTLLLSFSIIAVLRWKFNRNVQNFIFGARNASPHFNLLNIFLGGTMSHLPKGTFARTLVGMFMFYCLIIRNSYTGALFTFIKSDSIHRPILDSIDEMVKHDFRFYMIPTAEQLMTNIPKMYERREIMSHNEIPMIRSRMNDPSFNGGMISSLEQIVYFNMINHKNFTLNVCKERLFTFQYTIYMQKHSPLAHNIDLQLLDYQTNGMINRIVDEYVQFSFMQDAKSTRGPKALKLHQVLGCFWILILGHSVAVFVGVLECLSIKIVALRKFFI